jgi:hypothetical protein
MTTVLPRAVLLLAASCVASCDGPSDASPQTVGSACAAADAVGLVIVASGMRPSDIAIDGASVYWTNALPSAGVSSLMKVGLGGGTMQGARSASSDFPEGRSGVAAR